MSAIALALAVAIGVAEAFLALTGAGRTNPTPRQRPAGNAPLIHYPGLGAPQQPTVTATAIAALLMDSSPTAAVRASASPRSVPAQRPHASTAQVNRSARPDRADWEKIKTAASLRRMALAPHRTARFRAFAASLGLRELVSIHPLAPGRCTTAVTYLYDNLLDLDNAYPGEHWRPLRRLVAKEPSIHACAPLPTKRHA